MIAIIDDKTLKVQGRIEQHLLENFIQFPQTEKNSDWFFIDYSSSDFPLKSKFDFVFSSSNTIIPRSNSAIQIDKVYDSFGQLLEEGIPRGYKTLCKLTFSEGVPVEFEKLPFLKGWKSNSDALYLSSVEDFKIKISPQLVNDMFRLVIMQIINPVNSNSKSITKSVFLNALTNKLNVKDPEKILLFFTEAGIMKREQNEDELILNE